MNTRVPTVRLDPVGPQYHIGAQSQRQFFLCHECKGFWGKRQNDYVRQWDQYLQSWLNHNHDLQGGYKQDCTYCRGSRSLVHGINSEGVHSSRWWHDGIMYTLAMDLYYLGCRMSEVGKTEDGGTVLKVDLRDIPNVETPQGVLTYTRLESLTTMGEYEVAEHYSSGIWVLSSDDEEVMIPIPVREVREPNQHTCAIIRELSHPPDITSFPIGIRALLHYTPRFSHNIQDLLPMRPDFPVIRWQGGRPNSHVGFNWYIHPVGPQYREEDGVKYHFYKCPICHGFGVEWTTHLLRYGRLISACG